MDSLTHLNLFKSSNVNSVYFESFIKVAGRNLKTLNLFSSNIPNGVLESIAASCPSLQDLILTNCPLISDEDLIAICKFCPCMVNIFMGGCPKLSDNGVIALQSLKNLETIAFPNQIGDASVSSAFYFLFIGHSFKLFL